MKRVLAWPLRALGRDDNLLVRRSDRIEAGIWTALAVTFLIAAPVLALITGRAVYRGDVQVRQAERSWQPVQATVLRPASGPDAWSDPGLVARWRAPDGQPRTGIIPATAAATGDTGEKVTIWVDRAGHQVSQPVAGWQIACNAALTALGPPAALAAFLLLVAGCARLELNRQRMTGWERDWRATGPRWTRLP
jgi:hypothetical protein